MIHVCRLARAALVVWMLALAAQVGSALPAQAQTQVNPTELAVREDALLEALSADQTVSGRVSIPNERAADLIKPRGRDWTAFHNTTVFNVVVWAALLMLVVLTLFYLIRGRIRVERGMSGRRIRRFNGIERFAHWFTAVPFILLALTGLNLTAGRYVLLPLIGGDAFGALTQFGKLVHNFLAWPFMLGLAIIFALWIKDNIPSRLDAQWIKQGGGMLSKGKHPPARRFNAGQKMIFWAVVLGGVALSVTGVFLTFPTLAGASVNWQFTQVVHGLTAGVMGAIILAHIYLGSLGMEGAFDAMGRGDVDENWAREHHSLWVEDQLGRSGAKGAPPADGSRVAPAE